MQKSTIKQLYNIQLHMKKRICQKKAVITGDNEMLAVGKGKIAVGSEKIP